MKKLLATMMTVLIIAAMSTSVYAKRNDADVWISTNAGNVNGQELTVGIETNGKAADGVVKIVYDSTKVSCEEASVVFDDSVAMYSVNAEEKGVLKISYLAEKAIPEGTFINVNFKQIEESKTMMAKDAVLELSGNAHDAEGRTLTVDMKDGGSNKGGTNKGNGKNGNNNGGTNNGNKKGNKGNGKN